MGPTDELLAQTCLDSNTKPRKCCTPSRARARRRSTTRPSIRSHTLMTLPMSAHPPSLNKPIRLMLAHLPSLETPILPTSELALSSQNCKPINERKHGCYPCEEVSVSSRIPSVIKDVVMHRHRVYISNIVLESGLLRMNWN